MDKWYTKTVVQKWDRTHGPIVDFEVHGINGETLGVRFTQPHHVYVFEMILKEAGCRRVTGEA